MASSKSPKETTIIKSINIFDRYVEAMNFQLDLTKDVYYLYFR